MKSGVAMYLATIVWLAAADTTPAGDIVFMIVSDEKEGGDEGLAWPVENHPELFADIKCALAEFGGFSVNLGGTRTYSIQLNEK